MRTWCLSCQRAPGTWVSAQSWAHRARGRREEAQPRPGARPQELEKASAACRTLHTHTPSTPSPCGETEPQKVETGTPPSPARVRNGAGLEGALPLPAAWPWAPRSPPQCLCPHPVNGAMETVHASSMSGGHQTSGKGFVRSRDTEVSGKPGLVPKAPTPSDTAALRCSSETPDLACPSEISPHGQPRLLLCFTLAPWAASPGSGSGHRPSGPRSSEPRNLRHGSAGQVWGLRWRGEGKGGTPELGGPVQGGPEGPKQLSLRGVFQARAAHRGSQRAHHGQPRYPGQGHGPAVGGVPALPPSLILPLA